MIMTHQDHRFFLFFHDLCTQPCPSSSVLYRAPKAIKRLFFYGSFLVRGLIVKFIRGPVACFRSILCRTVLSSSLVARSVGEILWALFKEGHFWKVIYHLVNVNGNCSTSGKSEYINGHFPRVLHAWASRGGSLVFMGFLVVKLESEVHAWSHCVWGRPHPSQNQQGEYFYSPATRR